ncbi:MAG: hypothetical protein H6Q33_542, partial [Deltaproteobacteria bacterium]|nr:hypothetical protein [Deltaproteobacteria bacterium]
MNTRWVLVLSVAVCSLPGCALFLIGGGAAAGAGAVAYSRGQLRSVQFLIGGGAAAGAGAVAYSRGQLRSVQETRFERAWDAAQDAMRDLGFVVTHQEKDPDSAKLLARTKDNEEVEIHLKEETTTVTEIRIRVGWLGNEALSNVIL